MPSAEQRELDVFCFRAREPRTGWCLLAPTPGAGAVDLAALVKEAPEFVGMALGDALVRVAAPATDKDEAGLRLSVTVDDRGGIALVAVPSKQDRAAATALVREVLNLAGRLWRAPVVEFQRTMATKLGQPLSALLKERAGAKWTDEQLNSGLEASLGAGRFPVCIVAAALETEMAQAAAHLALLNIPVSAFGVQVFESWGVEVLLPRHHSVPEAHGADKAKPVHRPVPPPIKPDAKPQVAAPRPAPQPAAEPARTTQSFTPPPGFGNLDAKPAKTTQSFVPPPGFGNLDAKPAKPAAAETAKPTAPKLEPGDKVWSGTQPGVMSGKRPGPKPPAGRPK